MAEHLHLNNPPIKEALIDLRVALNKDVSVNQLRELHEQIQTGYPMRKTLRAVSTNPATEKSVSSPGAA